MEMTPEERREKVFHMGITLLSDTDRLNRASSAANTCVFQIGKTCYVLDPAFGKKRRKELAPLIRNADTVHVLCTHYHNDHCANNGWVARKGSKIYYHHRIRRKIRYLRTNGTGQIRMMAREMELPGMLRRFKMFPGWMITAVLFSARISTFFPAAFLFVVSYLYSLKNIGRIRSGWLKAAYLTPETAVTLSLAGMNVMGWQVDDGLYAMEAPGHTDDHLVYYLASDKVLFAGDALNFLNGNDIQFGDIEQVHETLDFLHAFVAKEQVEVLFQGHYYPVFGTAAILDHIDTIRNQHQGPHILIIMNISVFF